MFKFYSDAEIHYTNNNKSFLLKKGHIYIDTTMDNYNNVFGQHSDHKQLIKTTYIMIYYNKQTQNTQIIGCHTQLKGTKTKQNNNSIITKIQKDTKSFGLH